MRGLVVKNTGSWYTVKTDDGRLVNSKVKGNFRLRGIRSTNPVAVGDRVEIVENAEGTAFITEIQDRTNYIIRKSPNLSKQSHIIAANVDQALLVVTVNYPQTSTTFIDRFLASAEAYRVPVVLLFNKADLLTADERRYQDMMMELYRTVGYQCRAISAETGHGVAELVGLLAGKVSVLSGNSGVGKSTLINRILPGANLRTFALLGAVLLPLSALLASAAFSAEELSSSAGVPSSWAPSFLFPSGFLNASSFLPFGSIVRSAELLADSACPNPSVSGS